MNKKQQLIDDIFNVVVECCSDNCNSVSIDNIKSPSKKEFYVKARAIVCRTMAQYGFSVHEMSSILNRKERTICKLLEADSDFTRTNNSYQIMCNEVGRKLSEKYRK